MEKQNPNLGRVPTFAAIRQAPWAPWVGLFSLVTILVCALGAVGIVVASNNQTVDSWAIQPAVLLAILSSVLNIAFISALTPGLAVRFWLRAVRGTTLSQLHHIWNARGMGIVGALRAGSESRRVAVVSALIYIIQFANGPLLQRSTYQVGRGSSTVQPLSLDLAPNIPEGSLNIISTGATETMDATRKWIMIAQEWWQNTTILTREADGYFCNGTCTGNAPGVGITYHCSSSTGHLDYSLLSSDNKSVFTIASHLAANETGGAHLHLSSMYVSDVDDACMATVTTDQCNITAGLVEYPITVQNTTVSLRRSDLLAGGMKVRTVYSMPGDSPAATPNTPGGPLAALEKFVWTKLADDAVSRHRSPGRTYKSPGMLSDVFFVANSSSYSPHVLRECGLKWASPTEYVLLSLHDFMFRAAMHAGAELQATQTFDVHRGGFELIFRSNEAYLAVAVVAIGVAVVLLVVLIWGWWWLDFPADGFSPLGIAKAFGAPVLRDTDVDAATAATSRPIVQSILKEKGHKEFRLDLDSAERELEETKNTDPADKERACTTVIVETGKV